MKRALTLALTLLLLLSVMVFPARAADTPFTDIGEGTDYYNAIVYLYQLGLMNGTSDTTFSPSAPFTRAMFVTMLGRMEGVDPSDYPGSSFVDVPAGRWDAPYIQWASQSGIVNGVGNGRFNPTGEITVEQYCTIVHRFLDSYGWEMELTDVAGNWPPAIRDLSSGSSYAQDYVWDMFYWALIPEFYYSSSDSSGVWVHPKDKVIRSWIAGAFAALYQSMYGGGHDWSFSKPQYYSGTTTAWGI